MRNKADLDNGFFKSTTRVVSDEPETLDPTLDAIRAVVAHENAHPVQPGKSRQLTTDEAVAPKHEETDEASIRNRPAATLAKQLAGIALSFLKRRDAPRLLSIFLLLILIILRPGFVLFLFLMAVLICLVLYFSFGPDQVESFAIERFRRLRERDSIAAEKLRYRAAKASKTISDVVDKLPDRWTAGLHLPDFEDPPELPEKMKSDPFDRLVGQ